MPEMPVLQQLLDFAVIELEQSGDFVECEPSRLASSGQRTAEHCQRKLSYDSKGAATTGLVRRPDDLDGRLRSVGRRRNVDLSGTSSCGNGQTLVSRETCTAEVASKGGRSFCSGASRWLGTKAGRHAMPPKALDIQWRRIEGSGQIVRLSSHSSRTDGRAGKQLGDDRWQLHE